MRRDHRPYYVKKWQTQWNQFYVDHFLRPQFDHLGDQPMFIKPRHMRVDGKQIHVGDFAHFIANRDAQIKLSSWSDPDHQGKILIGDYCLICPGVRIEAATEIRLGNGCMIAAGCYLSDADWHDLYYRHRPVGNTRAIVLEDNVWLGDGVRVGKGVVIGQNSIIGTGAVVVDSIPANVIAVGNPAKIVKKLDPQQPSSTRAELFRNPQKAKEEMENMNRYFLQGNSFAHWLRALVLPNHQD